jgi:hypothetical protein
MCLGACQIEEGEVPEEGGERPWYIAKGTWKQEFTEEMYVPPQLNNRPPIETLCMF